MATSKHTSGRKAKPARRTAAISHQPGKGLVVSTTPQSFPATVSEKIVCAKSIIQAVIAAHDAEAMAGENYDIHWPLSVAVTLLEQAEVKS